MGMDRILMLKVTCLQESEYCTPCCSYHDIMGNVASQTASDHDYESVSYWVNELSFMCLFVDSMLKRILCSTERLKVVCSFVGH